MVDDLAKTVAEKLSQGLVLNAHAEWVPIETQLATEREIRFHLQNGEILRDGKWVRLEEVVSPGNKD